MPMYRTKPVEARRLDFDYPDQVADIEHWCNGKRFGKKLLVDVDGQGPMAHPGWYVVKTSKGEFVAVEPGLWDAIFDQMSPRA